MTCLLGWRQIIVKSITEAHKELYCRRPFETGRECVQSSHCVSSAQQIISFPHEELHHLQMHSETQVEDNETNTGHDMLLTEATEYKLMEEN